MPSKGQFVTLFFSVFLITAVIAIFTLEYNNLISSQDINMAEINTFSSNALAYDLSQQFYFLAALNPSASANSFAVSALEALNSAYFSNYILNLTSGISLSGPSGTSAYATSLPLNIINTQPEQTPAPFQQIITINSSKYLKYESNSLSNVQFSYQNGTIIPSWVESGNIAAFNGVNSHMNVANTPALNPTAVTEIAWIRPKTQACCTRVVSKASTGGTGNDYDIYVNGGSLGTRLKNATISEPIQTTSQVVAYNTWNMVAVTYNGNGTIKLYVNGTNVLSSTNLISGPLASSTAPLQFGCCLNGGSNDFFNGSVADVQIYNAALSQNQIQQVYSEGLGGAPISINALVGWWPLAGNSNDASGNGNSGVNTNITFSDAGSASTSTTYWLKIMGGIPGSAQPSQSIQSYSTLNVYNSQSAATASGFQQLVNLSSSVWEGKANMTGYHSFQNVEFFNITSGNVIDSWLENYTKNYALFWIKIPQGIAASSTLSDMAVGFAANTTNLFNSVTTGEAPQLSATYGQYDDGANVFNFYDNFSGTNYNAAIWQKINGSAGGGTFSTGTGLVGTIGAGSGAWGEWLQSLTTFSVPTVVDTFLSSDTSTSGGLMETNATATTNGCWVLAIHQSSNAEFNEGGYFGNLTGGYANASNQLSVNIGMPSSLVYVGSNTFYTSSNYGAWYTALTQYGTQCTSFTPVRISVGFYPWASSITAKWDWVDARAYPPNGVMPTVTVDPLVPALHGSSHLVVYMNFYHKSANIFNTINTGEAPQLSQKYGEYDDGANVFTFYSNFIGPSFSPGWGFTSCKAGGSYTLSDGATVSTNGTDNCAEIYSTSTSLQRFPASVYTDLISSSNIKQLPGIAIYDDKNLAGTGYGLHYDGLAKGGAGGGGIQVSPTLPALTLGIMGISWISNNTEVSWISETPTVLHLAQIDITAPYAGIGIGEANSAPSSTVTFQWARVQAAPPNGIMPSFFTGVIS